ncbi:MAG: tripartite tricarboxylate transporter substrate binding protein, partial [Nitrospira sp.]|nr:tripartite tricarboxylate transporter substrate binding protein [Nitrospira sp.]
MTKFKLLSFLVIVFLIGFELAMPTVWAAYPERPIILICPWAAGGGTDRIARMVAILLEKDLGQPVTVVNRTGGGGAVGHTGGATARPDGYTLTMVTSELTMMHWMGLAQVAYKDFKPVALMNIDPAGINVRADASWKDVRELEEYIKNNPGKLKASGTGKGGIWDLARAGWQKAIGLPVDSIQWVPSTGAATGLQELVAGGVDMVPCSLPEAASLIDAKKVKALAIMSETRNPAFPDVPTLKEQGIDWAVGAWRGITVPKNTPDEIVVTLEKSLEKITQNREYIDFMNKNGFGILYKPAKEFGPFLEEQDRSMG